MQKSQHTRAYRRLTETLRAARERSGLTQEDVVAKLGTYASFISKVESGERRVDVAELEEFAALYKKPVSYFLRGGK